METLKKHNKSVLAVINKSHIISVHIEKKDLDGNRPSETSSQMFGDLYFLVFFKVEVL